MKLKIRLTEETSAKMLASEGLIGMLADRVRTSHQTIKRQLLTDAPTLCLPHYVKEIKDLLGIYANVEITETYPINEHEIVS